MACRRTIPDINLINGLLTWEDNGEQIVNLIPQPPVEIVSELFNFYRLSFAGNGPTIGRFSLTGGALDIDFGVNLQTTNSDLIDLLSDRLSNGQDRTEGY